MAETKRYNFERYRDGKLMAEGVAVHAASLEEATVKAHKLLSAEARGTERETLRFTDTAPCVAALKCPICSNPPAPRDTRKLVERLVEAKNDGSVFGRIAWENRDFIIRSLSAPAATTPPSYEQRGIDWWNALSETDRAYWLRLAESARPADAWQCYNKGERIIKLETALREIAAMEGMTDNIFAECAIRIAHYALPESTGEREGEEK